jgi:hypothetical protein
VAVVHGIVTPRIGCGITDIGPVDELESGRLVRRAPLVALEPVEQRLRPELPQVVRWRFVAQAVDADYQIAAPVVLFPLG